MCLSRKYTAKQKREWLKDKPEMITAYKAVEVTTIGGRKQFSPPIYDGKPYKRKNRLQKPREGNTSKKEITWCDTPKRGWTSYIAYYHLHVNRGGATRWLCLTSSSRKIIKCLIPKRLITDIGVEGQEKSEVIVTKGFDIVGQDHSFDRVEVETFKEVNY